MRVGRILLALLAPLVSLPALAGSAPDPQAQTPAVDSLLQLLRSVVPVAAAAADSETNATAHAAATVWPVVTCLETPAVLSSAAEAQLHRLLRQQQRFLLRC